MTSVRPFHLLAWRPERDKTTETFHLVTQGDLMVSYMEVPDGQKMNIMHWQIKVFFSILR